MALATSLRWLMETSGGNREVRMRVDLDFAVGIPVPRIRRAVGGSFELELTLRKETVAIQLSQAGLERLWVVLSVRLVALRDPTYPPLPGSQN